MTEHLPECPIVDKVGYPFGGPCVCSALRACEQRVLASSTLGRKAFNAGVDAAHQAVAEAGPVDLLTFPLLRPGDYRAWAEARKTVDLAAINRTRLQ